MKKLLTLTMALTFGITQGASQAMQSMIINIQNVANSITTICNTNSDIIASFKSNRVQVDSAQEILRGKNKDIITNMKNFLMLLKIHAINPLALQQIYNGIQKLEATAKNVTTIIQKNKARLDEINNKPVEWGMVPSVFKPIL